MKLMPAKFQTTPEINSVGDRHTPKTYITRLYEWSDE